MRYVALAPEDNCACCEEQGIAITTCQDCGAGPACIVYVDRPGCVACQPEDEDGESYVRELDLS